MVLLVVAVPVVIAAFLLAMERFEAVLLGPKVPVDLDGGFVDREIGGSMPPTTASVARNRRGQLAGTGT